MRHPCAQIAVLGAALALAPTLVAGQCLPQVNVLSTLNVSGTDGALSVTVPAGCTRMLVKVWGSGGGRYFDPPSIVSAKGGGGGAVTLEVAVNPGEVYTAHIDDFWTGARPVGQGVVYLSDVGGAVCPNAVLVPPLALAASGGLAGFALPGATPTGHGGAGGSPGGAGLDQVKPATSLIGYGGSGATAQTPGLGGSGSTCNGSDGDGPPYCSGADFRPGRGGDGCSGGASKGGDGWYGGGGGGTAAQWYQAGNGGGSNFVLGSARVLRSFTYNGYEEIPGNATDPDRTAYACSPCNSKGAGYGSFDLEGPSVGMVIVKFGYGPAEFPLKPRDLDGNGSTDLLFRETATNRNYLWLMNGTTRLAEAQITPDPSSADLRIVGADDFDGNGRSDLVLRNVTTGAVEFWLMNGSARVGAPVNLASPLSPPWELAATGDFNHDGKPDLLWRNASTQKLSIWTLNGTTQTGTLTPTPDQAADANWITVAALDYDNDGNTDLLWYNVTSGKIVQWLMDASVTRLLGRFTNPANAGDSNWRVVAGGDFGAGPVVSGAPPPQINANDVVWRNDTSGNIVVWHMDFAGNRTAGVFTSPSAPSNPLGWTVVGPK